MSNNTNARRHFAIRSSIAKRAQEAQPSVMIFGRQISITQDNATLVEIALEADAQAAYAAASDEAVRLRERKARTARAA